MALADVIARLATDRHVPVYRRAAGTYVDGVYQRSAPTTLYIDCVTQPAFNLNRVIGGANMFGKVDGEATTDIRQVWTTTELFTRAASPTPRDPDEVLLQGVLWTVVRVERWDLRGQIHFHCVLSAQTLGAAPQPSTGEP